MKIIFSRKGFDAQCGGQPSPILPDGTLLSLPIPRENDIVSFKDLFYQNQSFFKIIQELKRNTKLSADTTCHLDPDIRKNIQTPHPENRVLLFGQCDASLTLLKKFNVKEDDLFLFFGWFRQTEYNERGKLRYKPRSTDLHVIYGYLQIGDIYEGKQEIHPIHLSHHPHVNGKFTEKENNCIYIAKERLSLDESLPGAGCFRYHPDLVLTQEKMPRSRWKPHSFFRDLPMTYHNTNSFRETYFQSAAQGQEFIMNSNEALQNWVLELIKNYGEK